MAKLFVAAIAIGTFYANPAWGPEGLPRGADGNPLSDRWIQPGESFWLNPDHWVHTYQNYARQVPEAPGITVDLPSAEPAEPAPAPAEAPAATESVAIVDQADQAPPDQADQAEAPPAEAPAPAPAPKKKSSKPKAPAAPPADPEPAPAPTHAQEAPPAPEAPTVAPDAPQE